MEVLKENRLELAVCGSKESFQDLLDSQKELAHSQINQLQNIVFKQCKLTGVNPLSQEMAAGALSIKIGKRPRDLLNPKAVKYMQAVFSIKDAITKKESREISARFGVTVTQVRDFFTSQRSRVRKFVRLSRDRALRSNAPKEVQDGVPVSTDPTRPIYPVPLDCVGPASSEEGPSCSTQDEILPGLDDSDRHFHGNIFSLMRKEETFSGQVKLMEWILQTQNTSLLFWFLTKGGVMILATWLSQAASEEQTSVLHVILKVLCYLPLHKALPVHMSAILQSVNSLRFYRTSDISNRARFLLSRWSKLFARSQAMKKPNAVKSSTDAQNEMLLKQSISEIIGDESREIDVPEDTLAPSFEGSENFRKLEAPQPPKLLPAPPDDSSKRLIRGVSSSQTRERRKVLLVEQPGQKSSGRSFQVARSVTASQGRPLSADDIQKAKLRAQFMQCKYGKTAASSGEGHQVMEGPTKISFSQARTLLSASKAYVQPQDHKDPVLLPSQVAIKQEAPLDNKMNLDPYEPLWKKCKRAQILWHTPAEVRIHDAWRVGTGENSKEVEVQKNRIRREKETIYRTSQEIPSYPKEPWDREMDYDDTLTLEIPTEQLPDADGGETEVVVSPRQEENNAVGAAPESSSQHSNGGEGVLEPDLELLAVLLKNPELVFALTAGQGGGSGGGGVGGGLSSEATVKLLDMIKANGVASLSSLTGGLGRNAEERVQVSLPSPTPSSDPVTSGWRQEASKNPFSRHREMVAIPVQEKLPGSDLARPELPPINFVAQQLPSIASHSHHSHHTTSQFSLHRTATILPEQQWPPPLSAPLHHSAAPGSPNILSSEAVLNIKNILLNRSAPPNLAASTQVETLIYTKPVPISTTANAPPPPPPPLGRQSVAFSSASLVPMPPQPQAHPSFGPESLHSAHSWGANQNNYNAFVGGPVEPPVQRGPPWDRNGAVRGAEFELWSPENSPTRSTEYGSGRNYREPSANLGHNYRSEPVPNRSRPRNSSGRRNYDDRYGNRRCRDWRR